MHAPRARFVAREVGPATIAVLVAGQGILWVVAQPAGEPTRRYVGQLLGAESILLLSIGLVLISTLPWVEEWFDGIDRAAIWHRRVAITGLALLVPHVLLSSSPHGTALGGPLGAIGAIGLVALALWAILPRWQAVVPAPFFLALHDYQVGAVREMDKGLVDVAMRPIGRIATSTRPLSISRTASTWESCSDRKKGAGTTDCHRGRIAHSASATRPIAPMAPSGPPSAVPCGLDDSNTCGTSRARPVIATRRCQIAARSIPSNHSSTHGSVLMSTRPIDRSRIDSAPRSCPT